MKYAQSETKNKFCKTKCVKLNFYKCVHFLLFLFLFTLWIYHFYCFPISFLLLYLSFHLDSVNHHSDFLHFSHFLPGSKNKHSPFLLLHNPRYQITAYIIWDVISDITKKNYLKVLKTYNLWSISNNYKWMKCYLRFMSKRSTTCPKLSIFS